MDHHDRHVQKDKNKEVIVAYHIIYDLIQGNLPIPPCVPEKIYQVLWVFQVRINSHYGLERYQNDIFDNDS